MQKILGITLRSKHQARLLGWQHLRQCTHQPGHLAQAQGSSRTFSSAKEPSSLNTA